MRNVLPRLILLAVIALLAGCTGIPDGVKPVSGFKVERYLGTWYEIMRLDHSFERGLSDVTANYRTRPDGGIDVLNRGYDTKKTHGAKRTASPIFSVAQTSPASRSVSSARSTAAIT